MLTISNRTASTWPRKRKRTRARAATVSSTSSLAQTRSPTTLSSGTRSPSPTTLALRISPSCVSRLASLSTAARPLTLGARFLSQLPSRRGSSSSPTTSSTTTRPWTSLLLPRSSTKVFCELDGSSLPLLVSSPSRRALRSLANFRRVCSYDETLKIGTDSSAAAVGSEEAKKDSCCSKL